MSTDPLGRFNDLPLAGRRTSDRLCTRFEADWRSGSDPPLESYLAEVAPDHQAVLLTELLTLDLEYRRQRGESPRPEDYARRFPRFGAVVRDVFRPGGPSPRT